MNLAITPSLAIVSGPYSPDVYLALCTALRYRPKGYAFEPAFKFHKWDGWQNVYQITADGRLVFPAGLLHRVRQILLDDVVTIPPPARLTPTHPTIERLPDGLVLRGQQVEAIRVGVAEQRGLFDLAPNFGKTEVIAGICACFPGARALVLLDSARLAQQDAERIQERLLEPVGVLGTYNTEPRIVVSTIQKLHLRLDRPSVQAWLRTFDLVLVDEAHKITGPKLKQTGQWWPVLGAMEARVRLGFSGSISDLTATIPAEAYLGPTLMTVTDRELIDTGISADPIVLMPYVGNWAHQAAYGDAYDTGIVYNAGRTTYLAREWMVWCAGQKLKTLALVYRKPHGKALAQAAVDAGLRSWSIDGDTNPNELGAALEASRAGLIDVLVASTIGNVGWDMPWLDVLMNAAAWMSPVATKQKLGRILRVNLDHPERRPIVIDPYDLGADVLKKHAKKRKSTYKKKGFMVHEGSPEEMRALLERMLSL